QTCALPICLEVCDHSFFQRADRLNVLVGFLVHLHSLPADCQHFVRRLVNRNDRRFVDHDFVPVNDQRICSAEVNSNVTGEEIKKSHEVQEAKVKCYKWSAEIT